jgi:Pyridoxamine 5'-phosphate oxidase
MTTHEPIDVTNLDRYGNAALEWSRPAALLAAEWVTTSQTFFLGTCGPDGRPHSAGVGAAWLDGDMYLVSGPGTRKSRNLAAQPACTISVRLSGIDLVFEGEAHRVTDAGTLKRVAAAYRDSGWPVEVDGDAFTAPYSAPSAGPAPWYLYHFTFHTVFGVGTAEPHGATRWRFS